MDQSVTMALHSSAFPKWESAAAISQGLLGSKYLGATVAIEERLNRPDNRPQLAEYTWRRKL